MRSFRFMDAAHVGVDKVASNGYLGRKRGRLGAAMSIYFVSFLAVARRCPDLVVNDD